MNFLIVTNAPTLKKGNEYFAYAPYVNEMNIWNKYVDNVTIISPTSYHQEILLAPFSKTPKVVSIPSIAFTSLYSSLKSCLILPIIIYKLFVTMKRSDHIHLRCPGNIGLLGCLVQILFPRKKKTAKYAGNWDSDSIQPLSYRLQKKILSNTFFTRNIQVLVYGHWKNQTKNIKSFFTATYTKKEVELIKERDYNKTLSFLFVGTLVEGKRPLFSIKVVEKLLRLGYNVKLDVYGEGPVKEEILDYVNKNNLKKNISIHGNKDRSIVKKALKNCDFLILPSKSEGWPKVVAEAMFFGVIPIATAVSCVPYMLDYGKRGVLINTNLDECVETIANSLKDISELKLKSRKALQWSQHYTLDKFESEIAKLLI